MIRTQVSLTEEQMERGRELADRLDISFAELVRRALDDKLDDDERHRRWEVARQAIGKFSSGHGSLAEDHDEALAETGW